MVVGMLNLNGSQSTALCNFSIRRAFARGKRYLKDPRVCNARIFLPFPKLFLFFICLALFLPSHLNLISFATKCKIHPVSVENQILWYCHMKFAFKVCPCRFLFDMFALQSLCTHIHLTKSGKESRSHNPLMFTGGQPLTPVHSFRL